MFVLTANEIFLLTQKLLPPTPFFGTFHSSRGYVASAHNNWNCSRTNSTPSTGCASAGVAFLVLQAILPLLC